MPKISVIVPVYRSESSLRQCVDSILCQSFSDFELILVNDGSPDQSGDICNQYASKDSRVRVIHQQNSGVSTARNNGLRVATGQYITFVDSDDTVLPQYLEHMIQEQELNRADVVITGFLRCVETDISSVGSVEGIIHTDNIEYSESLMTRAVEQGLLNACWGKLYLADTIRKCSFPCEICWGEDTVFVLSCLIHSRVISFIPTHEYRYRHSNVGLDRCFDLAKPKYMLHYYQALFAFTHRMLPNSTAWQNATDIKVSQEILRTILALSGNKISLRQKKYYLQVLFSNKTVNQSFCRGVQLDDNPIILRFLAHLPIPFVWLTFLALKEKRYSYFNHERKL